MYVPTQIIYIIQIQNIFQVPVQWRFLSCISDYTLGSWNRMRRKANNKFISNLNNFNCLNFLRLLHLKLKCTNFKQQDPCWVKKLWSYCFMSIFYKSTKCTEKCTVFSSFVLFFQEQQWIHTPSQSNTVMSNRQSSAELVHSRSVA